MATLNNLSKRVDAIEAAVQPPSHKEPFHVIWRDDDGQAWTSGGSDRLPLSEDQVDEISDNTEVLIVVKYVQMGAHAPLGKLERDL